MTLTERLERRLLLTDTGCLEWQGYRMARGYGQIGDSGRVRLTHAPFAKLTAEQVAEIRARYRPGGHPARREGSTAKELSDEFSVSKQYVRDLAANKWRQHGV